MFQSRISNLDGLLDAGAAPAKQPDTGTADGRAANTRAVAVAKALEIRLDELIPATRAWIAAEIVVALRAMEVSVVLARYAWVLKAAGREVSNTSVFDEMTESVRQKCRDVVRTGLLDRSDAVFADFNF